MCLTKVTKKYTVKKPLVLDKPKVGYKLVYVNGDMWSGMVFGVFIHNSFNVWYSRDGSMSYMTPKNLLRDSLHNYYPIGFHICHTLNGIKRWRKWWYGTQITPICNPHVEIDSRISIVKVLYQDVLAEGYYANYLSSDRDSKKVRYKAVVVGKIKVIKPRTTKPKNVGSFSI